jgi:hypothetical protein
MKDLIGHTVLVHLEGVRVRVLELAKIIEAGVCWPSDGPCGTAVTSRDAE